jgi:hypothetical protein
LLDFVEYCRPFGVVWQYSYSHFMMVKYAVGDQLDSV